MVAVSGDARADRRGRTRRSPSATRPGVARIGLGEAEIHVIVVGQDPQFPVRRVDVYSRFSLRGEISVSGSVGSSAGTKRTSLVALSPVAMKIRLWSCDRPTPTEKPSSSVSS